MIDWLTIAWKAPPLAAGAVRTWWRRDTSRNLSRAVVRTIDTRGNWPSGLREELVAQWWSVRDDEIVASLVRDLLDDPSRELEQHLRKRLRELLDGLILNLGSEETADRLAWIVIDQLSIAQKTSALQNRADHRRTQGMLGELTDKVETLSESLAVGSGPPPDANLVLPGDLNEDQERAIATFAETDSRLAAKLAALVTSSGVAALDGLLSVLPAWARDAPPQFWAAVSVLASDAGRHATALAAARREADEPTADRAAALVRAARAAYASGDDTLGDDLAHDAGVLEPDHPATLLLAAGRASDHTERLELAERARPRTKRQHAEQQAQRAFALIGLDRFDEAEEAAAESTKLDPHGNGLEAGYLLPIYRAVIAFPEMTVEPQLLGRCAAWFLERVPENRAAGRATYAGVAASRAATALAVAGDVDRVRALIDDALAKNEVLAPEAVSNFGAAAQIINDSERLLAVVPAAASDGARLQRAIAQLDARVDELQAANVLEELAGSSDSDIARDAATARVMASAYLALPLPEHLADHLHDDDRMFAYVRAQRAAQDGDFPKAQQELATFADPQSLALRIEMAEEAGEFTKAIHLSEKLFEEQPSGVQRLRLAAVRSRAGDLADARDDALVVARDQREVDGVRRRAFAFAAEWANEEGNFPAMEALTTEWLALDSTTPDATWWKAYALLRQHRYTEALQTLDAANATAQTDTQARVLAQALVFATIDPIERLQRLDALSDERGRPEWFEFNLITAVL
ncbi:MAG TPA: hypothetical protein VLK58_02895, partial [Conexibacter sp.]|nr:hypothetical protein [Conexibacter sp.]